MDGDTIGKLGLLGALILVTLIVRAQLPALQHQWRTNHDRARTGLRIAAGYLVFIALGIGVLVSTLPGHADNILAIPSGLAFFLGWILLGVCWIVKVSPRGSVEEEPASWLLHRITALEVGALAAIAISLPLLLSL